LLTENQKKQIADFVKTFKEKVVKYSQLKSELDETEKNIQHRKSELSEVAREERQMESAMEVLYGQAKERSKAREIEVEISALEEMSQTHRDEMVHLKTDLLELMRNLPIPADLENGKQHNSETSFPYFEGAELGDEAIEVILTLFRQEPPLAFSDVTILSDRVVVKNASERLEAIQKLVEAIRSFRMRADNMSKSYEKIDELVERLTRSKLYTSVLRVLAERGKLSAHDMAHVLNVDPRKVYDNCYNLTRNNWSPNPIKKTHSGEWELTLAGEILINRVLEKHTDAKAGSIGEESR